jgi:hypothetical protein
VDVQQGGSAEAVSTASSERASSRLHDAGSDAGYGVKSSGHEAMHCDGSGEVLGKLGAMQQGQCSVTMVARPEKGGCRSAGRAGCRVLASWVGETVEGEDGARGPREEQRLGAVFFLFLCVVGVSQAGGTVGEESSMLWADRWG